MSLAELLPSLQGLPRADKLRAVQFLVTELAKEEKVLYLYPTIAVPPSTLDGWMNLLSEGYDGDALADTEALYDEA